MTLAADLWFSSHCKHCSHLEYRPWLREWRPQSPPTAARESRQVWATAAPVALTWTPAEESSSGSGSWGGTLGSKLLLKEDTECVNAMAAGSLAKGSGAARETCWELSSGPNMLHEEEPSETMGTSQWGRRPHCH